MENEAEVRKRLGKNIAYYRKIRGFTQERLARETNISVVTLRNYEKGRTAPSFDFLINAYRALEVSVDKLLRSHDKFEGINMAEYLFPDSAHLSEENKYKVIEELRQMFFEE